MGSSRPRPPAWATTFGEVTSPLEALRLSAASPRLARAPSGDGGPVVLVPGLAATDASMIPLRAFLRRKRHDARPAGLGRIVPDVDGLTGRLLDLVLAIRDETGRDRVDLVGWSLGGVVSRVAARRRPDVIGRIVTFGTPVVGGPGSTAMASRFSEAQLRLIDAVVAQRERAPIRVPITAIWSRRDGIVSGAACIDRVTPHAENVEVRSTHLGMGIDPDVWTIVAERLAAPRSRA